MRMSSDENVLNKLGQRCTQTTLGGILGKNHTHNKVKIPIGKQIASKFILKLLKFTSSCFLLDQITALKSD